METAQERVSVILPYVNEWPQIVFTIRAIMEELDGFTDYEIIAVDNFCEEVEIGQKRFPDRGHDWYKKGNINKGYYQVEDTTGMELQRSHIAALHKLQPTLKWMRYDDKLGSWNCRTRGAIDGASGDILLYLDSHVMPSRNVLRGAIDEFKAMGKDDRRYDTLHLKLTYNILDTKELIYRYVYDQGKGLYHYSFFQTFEKFKEPVEVPCMSACGMFVRRCLFDKIGGGWPSEMGIYGGGENYLNFVTATLGHKKWIWPTGRLHHHGDKRGYHWNWTDYHRNRIIATYVFGGKERAMKYAKSLGVPAMEKVCKDVYTALEHRRDKIKSRQVVDIDEWSRSWEDNKCWAKSREGRLFHR